MKKILFFCLLACASLHVKAQSFTVNNTTSCDFYVNCDGHNNACAEASFTSFQLVSAGKTLYYASPSAGPFYPTPPPGMTYTTIQVSDCHSVGGPIVTGPTSCGSVVYYGPTGSGHAPSCGCINYNVSRTDDAFNNVVVTIY